VEKNMKTRAITLTINGEEYHLNVPVHQTLLQVIRDHLNLSDVMYGCGRGECGACTVLVDEGTKKGKRKAILACMTLAATMDGKRITTAGGLEQDGTLHPVQEAFVEVSAIQCGFCTPGMVLKGVSILEKNPKPTEQEIRKELEGNICRCTGYVKIVQAMELARDRMAAGKK
jgi:carbon-monoxide dehydrogenase small subunit